MSILFKNLFDILVKVNFVAAPRKHHPYRDAKWTASAYARSRLAAGLAPHRRSSDGAASCLCRRAPDLRLHHLIREIGEAAGERRLGGPQCGAVGGGDGIRGHREGAHGGVASAQDLNIVVAG